MQPKCIESERDMPFGPPLMVLALISIRSLTSVAVVDQGLSALLSCVAQLLACILHTKDPLPSATATVPHSKHAHVTRDNRENLGQLIFRVTLGRRERGHRGVI